MQTLAVLLPALGFAVIILMLVEIRQWRTGRLFISKRQIAVRILGGFILLALLAALFVGLVYPLQLRSPRGHAVLFLAWWSGCLLAAIGLLFLALADLRHVEERRRERENALWREFARALAERIRRERGQDQPGAQDEPR